MINNNGVGWSKQLDEIRDLITLIDALPFWKRRKVWKDVQAGKLPDIPSLLRRISAECIKVKKCFWCRSDVETNQVTHGPDDSDFYISCKCCGARGPVTKDVGSAIARWNS